ncbi:hypothetical protein T484DRAFT_1882925 [Baffinella frigidus]|nr:hypothetical protein T484DRAFT_1882925 [Cryptophyta sp. CCMP2293]
MPASYERDGDKENSGEKNGVSEQNDTELLLCLLAEVEEQFSESRGCVQGASSKLEEGKEFEAAAAERSRDQQLSEATRRKLQRRSQIINAEVKAELARAITQLRHASHHYKHVKAEVERAIRARDKRVSDMSHAEGFATALNTAVKKAEAEILDLGAKKEAAEARASRLQVEVERVRGGHAKLVQANARLKGSVSEQESALDQREQEVNEGQVAGDGLQMRVEALEHDLAAAQALGKTREVVARITADNLMFINKIKHSENKLEQAVREREMLRQDLNSNDARWFEHLRDELQKLTTSHMADQDASDATVAEVRESVREELGRAHARCQTLEGELVEARESSAAVQRTAEMTEQALNSLQEAHDDLMAKYHETAQAHGALTAEKASLTDSLEAARRDIGAKNSVIDELQRQLQAAARTVAEATSERDMRREDAERLSEEREKQKDINEIILREKHEMERKRNEIILRAKHEMERKVYSTQADMDQVNKKLSALKAEMLTVKQEKDIMSRQLSNWGNTLPSPAR